MIRSVKSQLNSLNLASKGPVAVVFAEDEIGLNETLEHIKKLGFPTVFVLGQPYATTIVKPQFEAHILRYDPDGDVPIGDILNLFISQFKGQWIYYCYNAEFLYFPFCETRTISDFVSFLEEERRNGAQCCTIDLYPRDLEEHPDGFDPAEPLFDAGGYYALDRRSADNSQELEKQIDVFGGLRWRFLQFVPWDRRHINNTVLFKASANLKVEHGLRLSQAEYETYAAPWHHSPTIANCSFRAAKYLRFNPDSRKSVDNFMWAKSIEFQHSSDQLMGLGMLEPGQWF